MLRVKLVFKGFNKHSREYLPKKQQPKDDGRFLKIPTFDLKTK